MTSTRKLLALALGLGLFSAAVLSPSATEAQPVAAGALAGKPYSVTVQAEAVKVGAKSVATVTLKPSKGYHLNTEFPTSLKLTLPSGVTSPKASLAKADAKVFREEQGVFEVALTSTSAGQKAITGQLRFAVCTEATCEPQSTAVTITFDVKP
jgi:hypothetical protein